MAKAKALLRGQQSYATKLSLNEDCKSEIRWWLRNIKSWNGKAMLAPEPEDMIIVRTDASDQGWGAFCLQSDQKAQGRWTSEEKDWHINVRELKAGEFGIRSFKDICRKKSVKLQMDNTTAVACINRMGTTRSLRLLAVTKEIWEFALSQQIMITAVHLAGTLNVDADTQSRHFDDKSDWRLNPTVFQQIGKILGKTKVDLFASRANTQLPEYWSWRDDPMAVGVNSLSISWEKINGYAFPPFCLVGRCLLKIRTDQADLIIIAPVWPNQTWYPMLVEMSIRHPVLLPVMDDLLLDPMGNPHPLLQSNSLQLAAWRVSGRVIDTLTFRTALENYAQTQDAQVQKELTSVAGINSLAGVAHGKLIRFVHLWSL
jgi:hypothetical protein